MKRIIIFFLVSSLISLSGCRQAIEYSQTQIEEETQASSPQTVEQPNCETVYTTLSTLSWDDGMEDILALTKADANQYAKEVMGDFQPMTDNQSMFPPELIVKLEEAWHDTCRSISWDFKVDRFEGSAYIETINELGASEFTLELEDMYTLFPEMSEYKGNFDDRFDAYKYISSNENCIGMFAVPLFETEENYVFMYDYGGRSGATLVEYVQRIDNDFVLISSFDIKNSTYGDVIKYNEDFYFIYLVYNPNIGEYDTICLHKLGNNPKEENLLIRFLPEKYFWKNVNRTSVNDTFDEELELYIAGIKDEIVSEAYLEKGFAKDIDVFYGEEKESSDFYIEMNPKKYFYKMDIANLGVPVYMWKSNMYGSGEWYLKAQFYLYDEQADSVVSLDNLSLGVSVPPDYEPMLVQMWFAEIEGKVVTFRVYYFSQYGFLLNAVIIEGEEVLQLRNDIFVPQRGFSITEGQILGGW